MTTDFLSSAFDRFYDKFMKSQLAIDMMNVREDSPYHREENVKEHTRMTIQWYNLNLAHDRSPYYQHLTKIALLFHDVGKPGCRTEKYSEERGVYFSYPGHELRSARLFEDYILENNGFEELHLSTQDFRFIKWLIENHLPYGMKKFEKFEALRVELSNQPALHAYRIFFDVLLSDGHGRISDDHEAKLQRIDTFIDELCMVTLTNKHERAYTGQEPIMWVFVGASGSSKSTLFNSVAAHGRFDGAEIVSLDTYRLEFYNNHNLFHDNHNEASEYSAAFKFCNAHTDKFNQYVDREFKEVIKRRKSIVLDNTNTSIKSRRRWITAARDAGYVIKSVEFLNPLSTLLARQLTRGDKVVPSDAVTSQFFNTTLPRLGVEVDEVAIVLNGRYIEILNAVNTFNYNRKKNRGV